MNEDIKAILSGIDRYFKRQKNTLYWLGVINNPFETTFKVVFNVQPIGKRQHVYPLHKVFGGLEDLEMLIQRLKAQVDFSIEFIGFEDMRWPRSGKQMQKRIDK